MPPTHMPVAFGLVKAKKVVASSQQARQQQQEEQEDIVALSQVVGPRCAVCIRKIKVEAWNDTLFCYG